MLRYRIGIGTIIISYADIVETQASMMRKKLPWSKGNVVGKRKSSAPMLDAKRRRKSEVETVEDEIEALGPGTTAPFSNLDMGRLMR